MNRTQIAAVALTVALTMSGCGQLTIGSSEEQPAPNEELTVGESTAEQTPQDTSRIPTEMEGQGVFVRQWQSWDRAALPSQYMMEMDDTALMLIEQVQNVSVSAEPMRQFDGISHARTVDLLQIALENTPAIEMEIQVTRSENGKPSADSKKYPDHVLTALLRNEQEEGRDLREFYYQEDVVAVYSHLFGDGRTLNFQDLCPSYYYYAREGVFAHKGERTRTAIWPMLVRYEDTENTITADLLLTEGSDSSKPLVYRRADGGMVELTADNYRRELAGEPVYRYTFRKQGEQLTLDGVRQIGVLNEEGTEIEDVQLHTEETLKLTAPEKIMVSADSTQTQIDLQKEYEETTASNYLLELLNKAQQVDSSLVSQVLTGASSETLTLTLGYAGGKEVVINLLSQGYLPGIEQGYLSFSVGLEQYILPQEDYALLTACLQSCKLAA